MLEIHNLTKHFGGLAAVVDLDLHVGHGEILGLIGPNGAGKSTVFNMIGGTFLPSSGKIYFKGEDITKLAPHQRAKRGVARIFQENILFRNFTAVTNILIGFHLNYRTGLWLDWRSKHSSRSRGKSLNDKAMEILQIVGLSQEQDELAMNLPHGKQRALCIAVALAIQPKILLLDECTVGLDPSVAESTRKFIKQYQKENNATILFTSHNMYEVEELCDRIAFISDGRIINIDTAENLKKTIKKQTVEMHFQKYEPKIKALLENRGINILQIDENRITFEVDSEGDKLYRLMSSLFKRSHFIEDLRIKKPSLEEIFIKITRDTKSEEKKD